MQAGTKRQKVNYKEGIQDLPKHFEILSKADQDLYINLQNRLFKLCIQRSRKDKKVQDLQNCIQKIRDYCIREDPEDKNRCFVCGIFWIEYGIAVNIENLQILIRKCRSSINTTLRKMGYELTEGRCDANTFFKKIIPDCINLSRREERLWSFRSDAKTCDINQIKNTVSSFRKAQKLQKTARMLEFPMDDENPQKDDETPFIFDDIFTKMGENENISQNFLENCYDETDFSFSQYFLNYLFQK